MKEGENNTTKSVFVGVRFLIPELLGLGRVISTASLVSLMVLVARLLDGALALPLGLTSAVCTTAIMCHGVGRVE